MSLHHDKEAFEELIIGAANELAIPTNVIEKDYYVTITLKALSEKLKDLVFKGGTSLAVLEVLNVDRERSIEVLAEALGLSIATATDYVNEERNLLRGTFG